MLAPAAYFTMPLLKAAQSGNPGNAKNIIIIVFDACSADNVSLYGYKRQTTPNLDRFAQNALVYHRHYSAGNFTVPGTASLLTGLYPWSHRAFILGSPITPKHQEHQLFEVLAPSHSTLGYVQNQWADLFLYEAGRYLQKHIDSNSFNLQKTMLYDLPFFQDDATIAYSSFEDNIVQLNLGYDGSLFFAPLFRLLTLAQQKNIIDSHINDNPKGLPEANKQLFMLNEVVDGAIETLRGLQEPTLTYLHFFPPHDPNRPTPAFYQYFKDGWRPPQKPIHPLAGGKASYETSIFYRQFYDEYLASWDAETGRLFDYLKDSGLLERSYVIVTSDHGEMFERGEVGHFTPLIYDPVVHSPLIISTPGSSSGRQDIYTQTSSVDILPTLAHLTGNPIPSWAEGKILPKLGGEENRDRSVYTVDAKQNAAFAPLTKMSIALTRNDHRLVYYRYPKLEQFEFYDLANDSEELRNIYSFQPALALQMKAELLDKLAEVNRPYSQ